MATTNKGIYYPTSSDQITPLESVFAGVASSIDNAAIISGQQLFTGPAAAAGFLDVSVTFTDTFTVAPRVLVSVKGSINSSVYAASIVGDPTTSGFTARVFRCYGSSPETDLRLVYIASTYNITI